jgi:DNA-binding MarR family transcriptional regulator
MRVRRQDRPKVRAVTELILETFRLNGGLLEAGDELVRHLGLTSARWQVLGAINASAVPLPIAHLARNMGLSRQAVQRLANEMRKDGLLRFESNPHHERAKLLLMTDQGKTAFLSAMAKQRRWAESMAEGLSIQSVVDASRVLYELRHRLEKG